MHIAETQQHKTSDTNHLIPVMNWFVVYTHPKAEKKVAERLELAGFKCYLPLLTEWKQWSDRKKKVQKPLLNSYVFVKIEEESKKNVLEVSGVVRFVYWLGKPALIKDSEIETMQQYLTNPLVTVAVEDWKPNDKVLLKEGIFKNRVGIVKNNSANQVTLVIESLGIVLKIQKH